MAFQMSLLQTTCNLTAGPTHWDFKVITSSTQYPQSNGLIEHNVQTIKSLLRKAKEGGSDGEMALLELCSTPITGIEESLAQLLMNRRLRSSLPMTGTVLEPDVPQDVRTKLCQWQKQQKATYDKSTRIQCDLKSGDVVRYKKGHLWKPAVVIGKNPYP